MFNRAWLAGGIPRTASVAAYEPVCAVSLADSYINRANPGTYNAYAGTAPTWSAERGWIFNGTSQYLKTGIIPAVGWSVLIRFSDAALSGERYAFGEFDYANAAAVVFMGPATTNGGAGNRLYGNGGALYLAGQPVSGVMGISGNVPYLDGSRSGSASIPAWSGTAIEAYIGGLNLAGGVYGRFGGAIQALYIYNVPITPTQVKAVTDAMNVLPMRPQLPRFRSWLAGGALTQFRKAFGLRTGSRGVPE